jgi:CRISPR-associated exonuclease Cas4
MSLGVIFFATLTLALLVLWLGRQSRAATRLPAGRLIYADTTRWRSVPAPLFSPTYRLTGRPDYLVQYWEEVIPVEVKSGTAPPGGPYLSHLLQLAAYCLLVEEEYDVRPSHGLILYTGNHDQEQIYEIPYTPALKEKLLDTLDQMRLDLKEGQAPRSHEEPARCQACAFHSACDQALV